MPRCGRSRTESRFPGFSFNDAGIVKNARHWIEFFDGATLRKGLAYQREGRVIDLQVMSNGLAAGVEGQSQDYRVLIQWFDRQETRFSRVNSSCTCPIGEQCKHAVAAIAEWLDLQKEDDDQAEAHPGMTSAEVAEVAEAGPEPIPQVDLLPPTLGLHQADHWLRTIGEPAAGSGPTSPPLVAVLIEQDQGWQVEPLRVKFRKDGGWGVGKRYRSWADASHDAADLTPVMRRFAQHAARWSNGAYTRDGVLSGDFGATGELFGALVDAGLLTTDPMASGPLQRGPALFTLECSRPALGPYTVMASLNAFGLIGWQMMIARSLEMALKLKQRLEKLDYCKVLNLDTVGPSVVWWVFPKGRNAKEIFQQVEEGTLSPKQYAQYVGEVQRLFERREKTMDPAQDARLGYTTSIGFRPHGFTLPAWKAVMFNPKTDEAVLDRLISSIEELS